MFEEVEQLAMHLLGENMAMALVVKALIATHPEQEKLSKEIAQLQQLASGFLNEKPPAPLTLFRYEQALEEFLSCIPPPRNSPPP